MLVVFVQIAPILTDYRLQAINLWPVVYFIFKGCGKVARVNPKTGLTDKQQRFVEEYLVDLNAMQAAIRAGFSKKTAGAIACEYLNKPKIKAELSRQLAKQTGKLEITRERILSELASIAFSNTQDFAKIQDNEVWLKDSDTVARSRYAAVSSVKQGRNGPEIRLHDKNRALEILCKYMGMLDSHTDTEDQGVTVIIDV